MRARIVTADTLQEIFIEEGCFIHEMWNTFEDPSLSVARARVAAHTETAWHYLDVTERYLICEGSGIMEIEGVTPAVVHRGDLVVVPAGCAQRICNPSEHALIFYCLCTPRFEPHVYHQADKK